MDESANHSHRQLKTEYSTDYTDYTHREACQPF